MAFSEAEILKEVHTGSRGAQLLTGGAYLIEDEHWFQVVSPNRLEASRNEIIFSQIPEGCVGRKIDEVIEFYKKIGTSFKWVVTPMTKPINRLLKNSYFFDFFGFQLL